jgi:hydrogenase maturation protein HypF
MHGPAASHLFLSQHVGDLESARSCETFVKTVTDLGRLLEIQPRFVAADLHPDYFSSHHASTFFAPVISVAAP